MKLRYIYAPLCLGFFLAGAYSWKVARSGQSPVRLRAHSVQSASTSVRTLLVEIEGTPVTSEDLDFEYSLHTRGIFDAQDLEAEPDLGVDYEAELQPLRDVIVAEMIERKLLYQFIKKDEEFDIGNPARFVDCIAEWQSTLDEAPEIVADAGDRNRLKQRLCERSLLDQYAKEKLFKDLKVDRAEIENFYATRRDKFKLPKQVVIRQIVLPSEKEAKRARHGLTRHNFARRAKEVSITPEAERGGLLGPFSQGEMPRLFDVAFRMRRGDIYGIHKSTYGFHLILLVKKISSRELTLEEATADITSKLLIEKREQEYQRWVELAINSIEIKSPKPLW